MAEENATVAKPLCFFTCLKIQFILNSNFRILKEATLLNQLREEIKSKRPVTHTKLTVCCFTRKVSVVVMGAVRYYNFRNTHHTYYSDLPN